MELGSGGNSMAGGAFASFVGAAFVIKSSNGLPSLSVFHSRTELSAAKLTYSCK